MEEKSVFTSQTMQGIAGLVVVILGFLGYKVATEDLTNIGNLIITAVQAGVALFFAMRAFVGRIKANKNLTLGGKLL